MDFYHTPTSCSQATHILLREARFEFRPHKVDIFTRTLEDGSDYAQVNPNGYVPALMLDDGMLLTENVAIIDWIAGQSPALIPDGKLGRTRHLRLLAFLTTEVHKPFIPLFFLEDEAEQARLREILGQRFRWIASKIEGDYLFGDRFTGADAFLYVMLRWAAMVGLDTPGSFEKFIETVERRGSVKAVLAAEGLQPLCAAASPLPAT
ncbi:glutathione S-transferase C-terminal domain-containing protein [Mesorhizobium sp.]|uniref:glutathione S-transferase C-terminal domain-containing protein n=1 Tax=Mesorhizobium sp. TaxID=1871066 RepID=UPI000FE5629A|nr:glutathione S-transferase C-terminal domain-containing protein [Mesorhizobium sp.]RWI72148.1 MAG: glutathione S-transferase [Mesorhizobium sp.]